MNIVPAKKNAEANLPVESISTPTITFLIILRIFGFYLLIFY